MLNGKERCDRWGQLDLPDDLLFDQLILLLREKLFLLMNLVLPSVFRVSAQLFCFQVRRHRLGVIRRRYSLFMGLT